MEGIELIARGVVVRDGKVLLAHTKGAANTFLPGGHIEPGEPAREALRREMKEELGLDARIGAFLGAVEHAFGAGKRRAHELNLVFAVELPGLKGNGDPASQEDHVEFLWAPLAELRKRRLEPSPLCDLLPVWQGRPPAREGWASTMEPESWQT